MISKRILEIREGGLGRGSWHAKVIYLELVPKGLCLNHLARDKVSNRGITNGSRKESIFNPMSH